MTAGGAANLHGLEHNGVFAGVDEFLGKWILKTIINVSAFPVVLIDESVTETTVQKRFLIPGGDFSLLPDERVDVFYDTVSARWRVLTHL